MIDLEISLAKSLGWSLADIDETAICSLLPFVTRLSGQAETAGKGPRVFADQVEWL